MQTTLESTELVSEPALQISAPRIDAVALHQEASGRTTLNNISFSVEPGEVVGIAGGSGAGKTTLLEALAGIRPARLGQVFIDGRPNETLVTSRSFGFVPQDDIIHLDLPLRRTLHHAAGLRMPRGTSRAERTAAVERVLERLDLADRAEVPVRSLSGGQRKRASIAVELLTDPNLFFLDEPTSGLDPATGATVLARLRHLAASGTTVVLTTHAPADLAKCDRVVFLARGGNLAFVGSPAEARRYFEVDDLADVYAMLADSSIEHPGHQATNDTGIAGIQRSADQVRSPDRSERPVGRLAQWRTLTARTIDLLARNRLTLAILLGSPAGVVAMLALLFQRGTFGADQPSALPAIQTLFWISFSSFFFGVTYGLLQIVGEVSIVRKERLSGLSLTAYVASKVTVLAPVLFVVNVLMLGVLRALDRLAAESVSDWLALTIAATLISLTGLSMGLVASALVQNPAQATLALPMLCFPQVLFAGAAIPTSEMASVGRIMSFGMANRWGFESMGRTLDMPAMIGNDLGTAGFLETFTGSAGSGVIVLCGLTVSITCLAVLALNRRLRITPTR